MPAQNYNRYDNNRRTNRPSFSITDQELEKIIDGSDPQMLVHKAEEIAKATMDVGDRRQKKLSTSQIRNIYSTVKILEMTKEREDTISRLVLIKPKLAYASGRHNDVPGLKILRDVLGRSIDLVAEDKSRFDTFCNFFEAILAYHKAEGGN